MPIKVPDNLPAMETLTFEGVDLITEQTAARQDIRPFALAAFKFDAKEERYRDPVCSFVWHQPFAGRHATDDYSQLYAAQYRASLSATVLPAS